MSRNKQEKKADGNQKKEEERTKKPAGLEKDEFMVVKLAGDPGDMKLVIPKLLGNGKKGAAGMRTRQRMFLQANIFINSTAGKYILMNSYNSSTQFGINSVSGTTEWGSFNSLFDEFFVHSVKFYYEPVNSKGGALVDGSTINNMQNCMLVYASYQHNQGSPVDSSTACQLFATASQRKITNTGSPHKFMWKNIDKFDPNGPLGDQSTSSSTQTWCNASFANKYGGDVYVATPFPSGAAAGIGTWLENIIIGTWIVEFDVSWRYRS